ncbi:hypothetical protein [Chroococcidiopsis sp.]|uniref:hypothetical protein n=1 Tax=Chroococcidiopsis sp. TaxID=3088168 RepID=UPI003F3ED32B
MSAIVANWNYRVDVLPDIYYDVRAQRWLYRDTKKYASLAAVQYQAKKYLEEQKRSLVLLGSEYSSGKLGLREFQEQLGDRLKKIHLTQMIGGLGKQEDVTAERFLLVGRNLKAQYYAGKDQLTGESFGLKYLVQDLLAGTVSNRQLAARLGMYAESGTVSYWSVKTDIAKEKYTHARRVLGKVHQHCGECLSYAGRGWEAIANIILPTVACSCRSRCKCSLIFGTLKDVQT